MTRSANGKMSAGELHFVFRVQDKKGRGPWKPGFSQKWVEDRDDLDNLQAVYLNEALLNEFKRGMHYGCACESLEQLRRWFTESEYKTLKRYGYRAVMMVVDRIVKKFPTQLIVERKKPLKQHIKIVRLYD